MTNHQLRILAATVASAAAVLGPQAAGLAQADTNPACSAVEVVFARGTFEAPGIGDTGQAFVDSLNAKLSQPVGVYAVDYPASLDFQAAANGVADASRQIQSIATTCPNTKIVLGGYSQGAAVMDMLAGVPPLGNKIGEVGSAPPLSPTAAVTVAAVATFGNPATKFGNPLSSVGQFASRSIDLCKDGDPICSDGRNPLAHRGYEDAMAQQGANFAAGRV